MLRRYRRLFLHIVENLCEHRTGQIGIRSEFTAADSVHRTRCGRLLYGVSIPGIRRYICITGNRLAGIIGNRVKSGIADEIEFVALVNFIRQRIRKQHDV